MPSEHVGLGRRWRRRRGRPRRRASPWTVKMPPETSPDRGAPPSRSAGPRHHDGEALALEDRHGVELDRQRLVLLVDRLARLGLADPSRIDATVAGVEEDGQVAVARRRGELHARPRLEVLVVDGLARRRAAATEPPAGEEDVTQRGRLPSPTARTAVRTHPSEIAPQRAHSRTLSSARAASCMVRHPTNRGATGGGAACSGRGAQAAARAAADPTSERNSTSPSSDPSNAPLARSGCGMSPTTLPAWLVMPAMASTEPLGLSA